MQRIAPAEAFWLILGKAKFRIHRHFLPDAGAPADDFVRNGRQYESIKLRNDFERPRPIWETPRPEVAWQNQVLLKYGC